MNKQEKEYKSKKTFLSVDESVKVYLDSLSSDVEEIDISGRGLTVFPDLSRFNNYSKLYCQNNKLTKLGTICTHIKVIDISNNPFALFIHDIINLQKCIGLKIFKCSNCNIAEIKNIPDSLEYLDCSYNNIELLPNLPSTLLILNCSNNNLVNISYIPDTCILLDCSDNRITALRFIPQALEYLYCYNNQLTYLMLINNTLKKLHCYNNNIKYITIQNYIDYLLELYCDKQSIIYNYGIMQDLLSDEQYIVYKKLFTYNGIIMDNDYTKYPTSLNKLVLYNNEKN